MPAAQKIAEYKQFHLWTVESDDNEACYIRIKEKNATSDELLVLVQTPDCAYTRGDEDSMLDALQQAKRYIDEHLA